MRSTSSSFTRNPDIHLKRVKYLSRSLQLAFSKFSSSISNTLCRSLISSSLLSTFQQTQMTRMPSSFYLNNTINRRCSTKSNSNSSISSLSKWVLSIRARETLQHLRPCSRSWGRRRHLSKVVGMPQSLEGNLLARPEITNQPSTRTSFFSRWWR